MLLLFQEPKPNVAYPVETSAGAVARSSIALTRGIVMLAEPLNPTSFMVRDVCRVVAVAAFPEVFWLPAVFTPGRSILAVPLNETPPMVLAVCRAVAVAALPEVELDVVALPFKVAVIVPALKLPEPSRSTIWLIVFALVAVMVALLA